MFGIRSGSLRNRTSRCKPQASDAVVIPRLDAGQESRNRMESSHPRGPQGPFFPTLEALAEELGIEVRPSDRTGLHLRVEDPIWVRDVLGAFGIEAILAPSRTGPLQDLVLSQAIADEEISPLAHLLSSALKPQAILFDLDGVLMDVEGGQPGALGGLGNINALAKSLPLGVVTGMGREQATRLLESSGIAPLIAQLVSADDATPKPSPDPVRLCLQRLGVKSAWMLGDNPTDMTAARLAAVIPLGVRPAAWARWADEQRAVHASALRAEGAVRVIDGIADVLPLLMDQRLN